MRWKVRIKGHRSRSPGTKNDIFGHFGGLRVIYVWQKKLKTSLASILNFGAHDKQIMTLFTEQWAEYNLK